MSVFVQRKSHNGDDDCGKLAKLAKTTGTGIMGNVAQLDGFIQ